MQIDLLPDTSLLASSVRAEVRTDTAAKSLASDGINLVPDASLVAILVIFIVNYFVVKHFFLKPINDVMTAREGEIVGAERAYEQSMLRFREATSELEAKVHEAKKQGSVIRESLRGEAAQFRAETIENTRREADGIVAAADQQLSGDVKTARDRVKNESEALARLAAERILGRSI